ncbi:bifunctional 2-polyprenyl-6-hydroxyphenol methylase/3-demethylubiquinol 3-O-methyltransferase UbiG [Rhodobacteraceae bacterium RKSG542]|uniref:bifunctional 2-polyprenyl-6-hydroxyphenol methylase/3-demethylubiquinol 3-O-methyltransferase UbiG n=1 Tax=Pseudovibrio flavus TaxID=2529854 RepID=UPI0012BCC259|nr:bifunctional 2-polyprenyl-6-hydroxyphenol methylase/3-demethylubiquinol 3-O-methyltransferase UbiG [Pseudovibrio flavus]MTI18256.1 bifunctional 2-polyprenyl-6-hydroxyphenol methylase/3-demethylubiquinol 3-O-methyltransferase UbiG [Pseudovibrio flavus]
MSHVDNTENTGNRTVDQEEVARFSAMAAEWWDPTGKFRPLHKFSPVRIAYIKEYAAAHFGLDERSPKALEGLRILDIGCGGGLLSEPMARMGATMVGADPSPVNINVAKIHAEQSGLDIDYRCQTAEELAAAGEKFDIVLNMEVVEHVADVPLFMETTASMVKPGGLMFVATLNRTLKAYTLAIVGAEYVLRWLPKGTHDYNKFVTPDELREPIEKAGMEVYEDCGVSYNPLLDRWSRSRDLDVNYMIIARRPA